MSTSVFEIPAPSSTSRASATKTASSASSPSSPSPTNQAVALGAGSSSLSTGAKAGIAIGAIFGLLILCLLVYIALLLRKKSRGDEGRREERNIPEIAPGLTAELPMVENRGELEGKNANEMWVEKEEGRVRELPQMV